MRHPEFELQRAVCRYLDAQYPKVLYLSDTVASVSLTVPQQVRNKAIQKQGFKCPDLLILHPNKDFSGLFIELKVEKPYKQDGTLYANPHIIAQDETLNQLNKLGYFAAFAWSFDMAKQMIDNYMAR